MKIHGYGGTGHSLLSSLSSKLHTRSASLNGGNDYGGEDSVVLALERNISIRMEVLIEHEEGGFLNLHWLGQATAVLLACHSEVQKILATVKAPLSRRDEKWIMEILDESAKLLDACNAIKEGLLHLEHVQMHLKYVLHILEGNHNEVMVLKARKALLDFWVELNNRPEDCVSSDSGSRLLQSLSDKLSAPKGGFVNAVYQVNVITILVLGALQLALPCGSGGVLAAPSPPHHYSWHSAYSTIKHGIAEEVRSRKKRNSAQLLVDLDSVCIPLKNLNGLVDKLLAEKAFPINQHDTQLKELVGIVRLQFNNLESGLSSLEQKVNALFKSLLCTRNHLLSVLTHARA